MVLARALASSRMIIGRRILSLPIASGSSARLRILGHSRCLYGTLTSGGEGPFGEGDHESQLVKALRGLGESRRLAAEGTPEERVQALASIEEAKRLVREATPEQRQRALSMIDESLRSMRSQQPEPLAEDPASAETVTEMQSGGAPNQEPAGGPVKEGADAHSTEMRRQGAESAGRPDWEAADAVLGGAAEVEESASGDSSPETAGADSIEEPRQGQEPAKAPILEAADDVAWRAADTPTTDTSLQGEATEDGPGAEKSATENMELTDDGKALAESPGLQEVPAEPAFHSVDEWAARVGSRNKPDDGKALEFTPTIKKIFHESPADPDDPRKWELIEPGHHQYPDLSKENRERIIVLRRTQQRSMIRKVDKVWLRNSCTCRHCVDPNTGWKNFNITSVPEELPTSLTRWNENTGDFLVHWETDFLTGDTHKSVFPAELFEFFTRPRRQARQRTEARLSAQTKVLWNADKLKKNPIRVTDYRDWKKRGDAFNTTMESLHVQGLAIIKGTDKETVDEVASTMGPVQNTPWGLSWKTGFEPQPRLRDAKNTDQGFIPRTHAPWLLQLPKLVILQCLENTVDGGDIVLVDGLKTIYDMDEFEPANFTMLSTYPFRFQFHEERKDGQSVVYHNRRPCIWPVINGDMIVRINQEAMNLDPLNDPNSSYQFNQVHKSLKAWEKRIVDPSNVFEYKMRKGDCSM